jgi:predicted enzyme related to lactoylglutathione lyase
MRRRAVMDWKLELAVIPVSDVDRAKKFYAEDVGFAVDYDRGTARCSALSS